LTSKKEQFYIQRISELEAQLKQRDERIAALEKQVAELSKVNAELVDISKMNKLCIEITHTRCKKDSKLRRKAIFRKMKKLAKVVANHAMKRFELLDEHWEQTGLSRKQAEQILGQISNVVDKLARAIRDAHERIIGERQVANKDKRLSLYEDAVNVIVRHKSGAEDISRQTSSPKGGLAAFWDLPDNPQTRFGCNLGTRPKEI
jgi:DNA mismatch repair ATPase MutS